MKRTLAVILIIIAAGLAACAKPAPEPEPTAAPTPAPTDAPAPTETEGKPAVSMFDLAERMRETMPDGNTLAYASKSDPNAEDEFSFVSDLEYGKVETFFILYAPDGKTSAAEIVVIALVDPADAEAAEASLRRHVEKRIALYSTYEPQFVPELEKAVIFTEGRYAVLIIGGSGDAPENAFREFINN
ncbi:MAG: DUF4358 domain-containing protein [Clostridia bacterium]|nr:DUF4358 domain-containing protein [Clostridia bacterium]